MKKMVFTAVALAMGMMAMATETAYVQIRLTGASGQSSDVFLTEDSEHSSAFESGVDTEKMMSLANSKSVLIYGYQGSTPCEDVVTNDLKNLQIGFTTNMVDNDYTLTFIDKEGAKIKLYDTEEKKYLDLDSETSYDFSVPDGQKGQKQVLDRFVINYVPDAPAVLDACFGKPTPNHLIINSNPYVAGKIVVFDGETPVVTKDGTETDIPLTTLTAGKHYTVKFFPTLDTSGDAAKTLIIVPVTLP